MRGNDRGALYLAWLGLGLRLLSDDVDGRCRGCSSKTAMFQSSPPSVDQKKSSPDLAIKERRLPPPYNPVFSGLVLPHHRRRRRRCRRRRRRASLNRAPRQRLTPARGGRLLRDERLVFGERRRRRAAVLQDAARQRLAASLVVGGAGVVGDVVIVHARDQGGRAGGGVGGVGE